MSTDLGLAHLGSGPTVSPPRQVTRATLLNTPASQSSPLFVVFTDGHEAWPHEVVAGHWEPRGLTLPAKGDICVALIDSLGDVWVVGWEGTTNVTVETWHESVVLLTPPVAVYNGASWTIGPGSALIYGAQTYNVAGLQNDGGAWRVNLSAGTWSMTLLCSKAATQPIVTIDVSFDGGVTWTTIGTVDQYGSGQASPTFTGINVPADGAALVRFRALSKNASSTGYFIGLSGMEWSRTA